MADKGPRKSAEDYEQMDVTDEEELVTEQLREMEKGTLVKLLIEHAWEEMCELLNNETIERWANAHDEEYGKPLDERDDDELCAGCGAVLDPTAGEEDDDLCPACIRERDQADLVAGSYADTR